LRGEWKSCAVICYDINGNPTDAFEPPCQAQDMQTEPTRLRWEGKGREIMLAGIQVTDAHFSGPMYLKWQATPFPLCMLHIPYILHQLFMLNASQLLSKVLMSMAKALIKSLSSS
jgi:hypothetical protein